MRCEVSAIAESAVEHKGMPSMEDWKPIETAPKDGTKIRVKRDLLQESVHWSHDLEGWVTGPIPVHDRELRRLLPWEPTHWTKLSA
jgi:hypothetical protein